MAERVPNGSGHAVNGGGGRGRGISSGAQRRPRNRNHAGRGRGKPDATPGPPRDSLLSRIGGIEPAGHLAAVASVPGSSRQFSSTGILEGYTSGRRFAETSLSPTMKAAVPFEFMSEIQSATIDVALTGVDILAQAKTGTGKTVAFLVPAIERLAQSKQSPGSVSVLVMSPTRELAMQIAQECQPLLQGSPYRVQTVYGGTNIEREKKRLANERCDILVATPGRLIDHLANHGLSPRLAGLRFLVLDEADRLLDMGFRPDIERILARLPDRRQSPRQAMLFSATIPPAVMQVKNMVLLPNHAHVSTIKPEEVNAHLHVPQHSLIAPLEQHLAILCALIHADVEKHGSASKVMAFFSTARQTSTGHDVFAAIPGAKETTGGAWELHSRMSQSARTKTTDAFRKAKGGVLFTSDVSGRGMDFPDVTLVIQVGMPQAAEDYVHRLGRTARAGASGEGVILLGPFEKGFLNVAGMRDMPIKPHPSQAQLQSQGSLTEALAAYDAAVVTALTTGPARGEKEKAQAYQAFLGFYQNRQKVTGLDKHGVVQLANDYAHQTLKWPHALPPPLLKKTVGLMGLKGIPGLNVVSQLPA